MFATAGEFPSEHLGRPVVSGEVSDYRYGDPSNVVIALKARGAALRDTSGFVIRDAESDYQEWKRRGERAPKVDVGAMVAAEMKRRALA